MEMNNLRESNLKLRFDMLNDATDIDFTLQQMKHDVVNHLITFKIIYERFYSLLCI